MAEFDDGYESYYANRLWQLLPGVYRAQDSEASGVDGPLQELVNRVGAQIAVVRRSIDRLWADQSIETSDDWVIPYIGALLDTNLLANLDAAGQRVDVAKTIHYRRRKGTVAILEELARDVTGWQAHVVEALPNRSAAPVTASTHRSASKASRHRSLPRRRVRPPAPATTPARSSGTRG